MQFRFKLPAGFVVACSARSLESGAEFHATAFRETRTAGITNRVELNDGTLLGWALFADLDDCTVNEALRRVNAYRDAGNECGDAYIFTSSERGVHVFCPVIAGREDVMRFSAAMESGSSLGIFMRHGEMTLRCAARGKTPRPEFALVSPGLWRGKWSAPHLRFLSLVAGVELVPLKEELFGGETAVIKYYSTVKG